MTAPEMTEQVIEQLKRLSKEDQRRVLDFARTLNQPKGTPGSEMLGVVGAIPADDLDRMKAAINDPDCGFDNEKAGTTMMLEDYFDFLERPYTIRLKGHRIGVEHIVERYQDGFSPEQIVDDLPTLSLEEVYGAITFYLHNKAEIDAYVAAIQRDYDERVRQARANPSPVEQRMMALLRQQRETSAHENTLPTR